MQRKLMVENQLKARGINDEKVIQVMLKVPRHLFVPEEYRSHAYEDRPLPIGEGQTISQPYIVAYMTQQLALQGEEKILEIGTGSGYQTAILAELAKEIYTIEIKSTLAEKAKKLLEDMGYDNIKVKTGDGYKGWEEYAPYDAIIVTAAPDEVPQALIEQLKDKGRMVLPLGKDHPQVLVLIEKKEGKIYRRNLLPVLFVPMIKGKE